MTGLPTYLYAPDVPVEATGEHTPFDSWFVENQVLLVRLNTASSSASYDSARRAWERITWLQTAHPAAPDVSPIDNNRSWVAASATVKNYPEAGAWQLLEREVTRARPDGEVIRCQTDLILTYIRALRETLSQQPLSDVEIRFLLAIEVYRQFNLTLSGHYRLNPARAVDDFLAFLSGLVELNESFDLIGRKGKLHLDSAISYCQDAEFASLDRYALYRDHLRPFYRSLLRDVPVKKLARKYGVAAAASGELFSVAYMEPVTVDYSPATVDLGKLLFFDPLLSGNGRRSCASCHQPSKAFSDGRITSMAFDYPNRIKRNAPGLINVTTGHGVSGVDQGKLSAGHFIQSVFDHPQEMNVAMDSILIRLSSARGYRDAFANAFPGTGIDSVNVLTALAAYIVDLRGVDGTFDREIRATDVPSDSAAIRGFNLFTGKATCASCHFAPYFDGRKPPFYRERSYQSAGRSEHLTDLGVGETFLDARYNYFFRIPGLRNLSYSAPYGHDGYFVTLRGFIRDHHGTERINAAEMADLLHFMSTLNDSLSPVDIAKINLPIIDGLALKKNRRPAGLY